MIEQEATNASLDSRFVVFESGCKNFRLALNGIG